jgi:comEA protein
VDFFGNKIRRLLLILGVVSLFVWIVWPFLRGGQSTIQTAFMPINTQMEALLMQEANEKKEGTGKASPAPTAKATKTPKESSTSTSPKASSSTTTNSEEASSSTLTRTAASNSTDKDAHTPSSSAAASPEPTASTSTSSKAVHRSTELENGLLDLNTATLEQLDKLPGIGESKAKAIIEYRTKKGRYKRVEELMEVKGIGEKMFEKLKVLMYVAPS